MTRQSEELLRSVTEVGPRIRSSAAWIETNRRLPDDIFAALAELGVFKAHVPVARGGGGLRLAELAPVIEEIARADGSAGWLAYVGSEAMRQTLLLDESVAAQVTR